MLIIISWHFQTQPIASHPIPPPRSGAVLPTPTPDSTTNSVVPAAVLATENVHIAFNNTAANNTPPPQLTTSSSPAVIDIPIVPITTVSSGPGTNPGLRTIELSSGRIREGFGKLSLTVDSSPKRQFYEKELYLKTIFHGNSSIKTPLT